MTYGSGRQGGTDRYDLELIREISLIITEGELSGKLYPELAAEILDRLRYGLLKEPMREDN